jgi:AcrR family transcriptional regulator
MARPRQPLSRDRVLETAMRLADENGIESLTMRKLARELGVEAMSLYNHVASKGDLVDAIVDLVIEEIEFPSGSDDWRAEIRTCALSAHEAYLRHSWACSLAIGPTATRGLRETRLRYMEWLLARLRTAGFSADLTYHAYHVLDGYILGFTMWQLGHGAAANAVAEGDEDFDLESFLARLIPELRERGYPNIAEHGEQHVDPPVAVIANGFEFGLDMLLDGLERARGAGG